MNNMMRVKKTGQLVTVIGKSDVGHTLCLFPLDVKSKAGNLADVRSVRNENLVEMNPQS